MTPEVFLENFGHIAGAPNGIKKLRELILQLAVRGKLVEQDPNDEPASKLLERLQAEKSRLVKEKKIRKSDLLSVITAEEVPYELPHGWIWVKFSDFVNFNIGRTPKTGVSEYWDDKGTDWVSIADMTQYGTIKTTKKKVSDKSIKDVFKCNPVPAGTILMSFKLTIGKVSLLGVDAYHNEAIISIFPFDTNCKDYLYRFLPIIASGGDTNNAIKGQTLNSESLTNLLVPSPPIKEQHRIVTKVDQLMVLCDEFEIRQQKKQKKLISLNNSALNHLTSATSEDDFQVAWKLVCDNFDLLCTTPDTIVKLRQSILQLAVLGKLLPQNLIDSPASLLLSDINTEKDKLLKEKLIRKNELLPPVHKDEFKYQFPESWGLSRFSELADIVGGVTKGRNLAGRQSALYPYLRVANVQRGYLDVNIMKEIEIPIDELEKYRLIDGDLLITEGGDWDKVGRTAIWQHQIENCIHQNHVFRARLFTNKLNRNWLMLYLNSVVGRKYFEGASKQTTNLASINMTQLRYCPIPIPPPDEQHRIVAKVDQLMTFCDKLEFRLTKAQSKADKLASATIHGLLKR